MRHAGPATKANVGMSNDKRGEKPLRRKTKGSSFDVNQNRVSRDLRCSRKAKPMANRLIFLYQSYLAWGDGVMKFLRRDGILRRSRNHSGRDR